MRNYNAQALQSYTGKNEVNSDVRNDYAQGLQSCAGTINKDCNRAQEKSIEVNSDVRNYYAQGLQSYTGKNEVNSDVRNDYAQGLQPCAGNIYTMIAIVRRKY